jgi:acyl-CoA thioester hydrolase
LSELRTSPRTELRCRYEGVVTDDQIDHLGHMNVRFYATKARAATDALLLEYGLGVESCAERGVAVTVPETFTRHYREQLVGAHLAVMTGVLSATEAGLRVYHELVNRDSKELAATFVHEVALQDSNSREKRPFPSGLAESAQAATVVWPNHGRPRTMDLDRKPGAPRLEVALERDLAIREPRTLTSDECDPLGFFVSSQIMNLVWGGEPIGRRGGWPVLDTGDGRQMGWPTLESRHVLLETPRVGSRLQSFSAVVDVSAKTYYAHYWVFDIDRARPICTSSTVNLAFDIGARKAIEIPDAIRTDLEAGCQPDLA